MTASYEESFAILQERVGINGEPRPDVERTPRADDEVLGPSIFRLMVEDVSLEDLSVPGLYVGRSELSGVSFRGSDLHLSTINWSDLVDCDFSSANLARSDLRACRFTGCDFSSANLDEADLRGSSFKHCTFAGASLRGTLVRRRRRLLGLLPIGFGQEGLALSAAQRGQAEWSDEAPPPSGG